MYKRNFYFLLALPVLLISCSKTDGSFSTINDSSQIPTAVESNSVNSALKKFNDGVIVEGIENQSFIVPSNSSMNQLNNYEQRIVYQQKDHIANETTMTKVGDPSTSSHFIYLRDEDGDATVETFAADNTITTTKVLTMNGYLSYDAYFYNPFLTLKEEDLTPYEDGTYAVEPTKAYYIVFALLGQQFPANECFFKMENGVFTSLYVSAKPQTLTSSSGQGQSTTYIAQLDGTYTVSVK